MSSQPTHTVPQDDLGQAIQKDPQLALTKQVLDDLRRKKDPTFFLLIGQKPRGRPRKETITEVSVIEDKPKDHTVVEVGHRKFNSKAKQAGEKKERQWTEEGRAKVMANLEKGRQALMKRNEQLAAERATQPVPLLTLADRDVAAAKRKEAKLEKLKKQAAAEGKVVTTYVLAPQPQKNPHKNKQKKVVEERPVKPRRRYQIPDDSEESEEETEETDASESTDTETIVRRVNKHAKVLKAIDRAVSGPKEDLAALAASLGGVSARFDPWSRR